MLDFLKKGSKKEEKSNIKTASGYAATDSARKSTAEAAKHYAKPEAYTGNRTLYDSGAAKVNAKKQLFNNNAVVKDPYTGDILTLTKAEAKQLYGADWQKHLAESDHVKPLEQIFNETKNNPWNTTEDIKNAANSPDNIKVASRKFNNAKRSRTNKEYVNDDEYLASKGVQLADGGKEAAIRDGEIADSSINRQLHRSAVENVVNTGHEAGVKGAQSAGITAGTMSGIMNMVSVINGEKTAEEAIEDVIVDSGKAAVTGYAMGSGLTVVSHSLSNSSSSFLKALSESNVPGKVITAVIVTGDTLKQYANGEITTQECLIQLGDKGLNLATTGYSMMVGQALIPIPVVGAAVGALVGSMATSQYYHQLIASLQTKELEHQERVRIINECQYVAEQAQIYRCQLEEYLNNYFYDYRTCFDDAISQMNFAFQSGDADGIIAGANQITRKLGGNVYYNNVDEFKSFLDSDMADEF